jgi:3-phenylpropionate/trans-cinnamate dioxygenase ferredoxin reductase subunit
MVIVGAGDCGTRTALMLREHGYSGPVTLIGDEDCAPYERPSLSKTVLLSDTLPTPIVTEDRLRSLDIAFLRNLRATRILPVAHEVECEDGRRIPYSKLLLATGALPRRIPQRTDGVQYLRTWRDCQSLRATLATGTRLLVLGAGFLGLEVAAAARTRGAEVTVVESQPQILQRGVPPEIAAALRARHIRAGVAIHTGVVADVSTGLSSVRLGGGQQIETDCLVAAIGAVPNTRLGETASLAIENGILVDATLRTSDPDIFAAGDCCAFPLAMAGGVSVRLEAWRAALDQAEVAAHNMAGGDRKLTIVPWFWSDQYDTTLQIVGLYSSNLATVRRDVDSETFVLFHSDPDHRLVAASGYGPTGRIARDMKIAEMLIATSAQPDPGLLSRPEVKLKLLLPN